MPYINIHKGAYSYGHYIKKQVKDDKMPELEDRKVVEHNDLITSIAKMDKTPLKIFELAASCIDTENPPKDNIVYLSKVELFKFFDVSDNDKHSRFKQAIEVMQKQAFFEVKEKKGKGLNMNGSSRTDTNSQRGTIIMIMLKFFSIPILCHI
jgi:plasmid replication initiation protein